MSIKEFCFGGTLPVPVKHSTLSKVICRLHEKALGWRRYHKQSPTFRTRIETGDDLQFIRTKNSSQQ
jgi:hypothetical protein